MQNKKIMRVLDANFNRAKEGLRVAEDIFRFVLENDRLRVKARGLRHGLDKILKMPVLKKAILERDSKNDLGRKLDSLEAQRRNADEVLFVNLQRVKESLRVLEELFKTFSLRQAAVIKNLRYKAYSLEKDALLLKK